MYEELQHIIDTSHNIVFFGGAGTSTESGVPDFRSPDGLYGEAHKFVWTNGTISTETVQLGQKKGRIK